MSISVELRNQIREKYKFACGYCGISEVDVGSELEIDHFHPTGKGGTDEPQNLVYSCTTCNRFKSNYWPPDNTPQTFHLLHPIVDDLTTHIQETADGRINGLTQRGWFHIRWLHLNRPQLIAARQLKQNQQQLNELIAQAELTNHELRTQVQALQSEIIQLRTIIARLRG